MRVTEVSQHAWRKRLNEAVVSELARTIPRVKDKSTPDNSCPTHSLVAADSPGEGCGAGRALEPWLMMPVNWEGKSTAHLLAHTTSSMKAS
jgi:hypothetical protein